LEVGIGSKASGEYALFDAILNFCACQIFFIEIWPVLEMKTVARFNKANQNLKKKLLE
jgi:hypothetical protein